MTCVPMIIAIEMTMGHLARNAAATSSNPAAAAMDAFSRGSRRSGGRVPASTHSLCQIRHRPDRHRFARVATYSAPRRSMQTQTAIITQDIRSNCRSYLSSVRERPRTPRRKYTTAAISNSPSARYGHLTSLGRPRRSRAHIAGSRAGRAEVGERLTARREPPDRSYIGVGLPADDGPAPILRGKFGISEPSPGARHLDPLGEIVKNCRRRRPRASSSCS
jgi:hypothetical protein